MNLLDLPEEVIVGSICSYLNYNDVLRLRLVNKQLKKYADSHLKVRVPDHYLEINDTDKTFGGFMTLGMGVRATRIYLNVKNYQFFTSFQPDIKKFLDKYGTKVTHLCVAHFSTFIWDGEMDFYGALNNLKHLEFETIDARKRTCDVFKNGSRVLGMSPFPQNFKNLETLKFGHIDGSSYYDVYYQWDFFDFCEHLVHFKYAQYYSHYFRWNATNSPFAIVPRAILQRKEKFPDGPHLKYYDINWVRHNDYETAEVINLLKVCVQHDVKLLNVNACALTCLLKHVRERDPPPSNIGVPIVSMGMVIDDIFCVEMPNLEKMGGMFIGVFEENYKKLCLEWPKLKSWDIIIDCRIKDDFPEERDRTIKHLFDRDEPLRANVTNLRMQFVGRELINPNSYPKAGPIIATCPNLTKLTMINFPDPAPNMEYSKLWKGLKFLQELYLEDCITLGDSGFIGENVEKPAFLELKCLKKLTLKRLPQMPKITNTFLQDVLRHMKLAHLIILGYHPLTSISHVGVSSLLTGEFAKSIEKFPFKGWSLSGVSAEEFQRLASQFRSL